MIRQFLAHRTREPMIHEAPFFTHRSIADKVQGMTIQPVRLKPSCCSGSGPASSTHNDELELMRVCQRNLREDYDTKVSLTQIKRETRERLERLKKQAAEFYSTPDSTQADIRVLELEMKHLQKVTAPPNKYIPRGMVARLALRLLGGPAAKHVGQVVCVITGCQQISNLAALKSEHTPSE